MKTTKLFSRLIAAFGLTIILAISGWAAVCPSSPNHTFSSTATTFSSSGTIVSNAATDEVLYYFTVSQPGIVTFTETSVSQIVHKYDLATCPTATTGTELTDSNKIVVGGSGTFYIRVSSTAANKTYNFTLTFEPTPLVISKTNTPMQVAVNTPTNVTYTLSVQNTGSEDISNNIVVTDTIPAGLTYVSSSGTGWTCTYTSPTVTCTRTADLYDGEAAPDINITATANISSASSIVNTANVNGFYDGDPVTNSASSTLLAVSGAGTVDLEIQKFASSDVIPPDTDFMYLMFVVNYDNTDAQLVKVTDTLPPISEGNITLQSAGGNGWTCTIPSNVNDPVDANRTFVCDYNQPLGKGITYFLVNAHTGTNNAINVRNLATVSALNTISENHNITDYADINISTEGSSGSSFFTGYYPQGGSIEVSDRGISNRANAQIWTKIASTQDTTFPVYFVNPSTGAVTDYNGTTQDVPLTVIFKLTDDTCSAANETYLSYDSTKSVIAEFDNGYGPVVYAKTKPDTTFDLRNLAKKNGRLLMKYIDIQQRLDTSGESCSNSNLSANIKGLPQCIANSTGGSLDNNKYINVFGIDAFVRCAIGNGQPCKASNGGVGNAPYDSEYGCYECTIGGSGYCSKDNFAIRPKQFDLNISNGAILKAKASNFAFKGLTNNTTTENTLDYNETQNTTFTVDINVSDATRKCQEMNLSIAPQVAFHDGLHMGSFRFSNVGDVNLTIHDINGSEFGKVDENDTNPTVSRFITPYTVSFQIIPDHFKIEGNITNGSNGFTYLSNFEEYNTTESKNISASLDLNVSAVSDQNVTMTNYSARNDTNDRCYAKDGNFAMNLAAALSPTPVGSLSKFLWSDINHADHNGSLALNQATYIFPIKADQYDNNDTNGTAGVNYVFNFDRNQTKVVNPIEMTVNNLEVDDSDLVHGEKDIYSTISYRYGRIIPRDIRVFGANKPFTANAWYEVYNSPIIGATSLPASKNDSSWFTNLLHSDTVSSYDGDGNVTVVNITSMNVGGAVGVDGMEDYTFIGGMALGGYKAHINTDPWLWYGANALGYLDPVNATNLECLTHPCFNINVVNDIGRAGSATSEALKSEKTNKESQKPTGIRYDYTPVVQ